MPRATANQAKATRTTRKRTERWYAVLALLYLTAQQVSRAPTVLAEAKKERRLPPTPRIIAAEMTGLKAKNITNSVTKAKEMGIVTKDHPDELFGRSVESKHFRTDPGGQLTPYGLSELGSPPAAWVTKFGNEWTVVRGERSIQALDLLAREFEREVRRSGGKPRSRSASPASV